MKKILSFLLLFYCCCTTSFSQEDQRVSFQIRPPGSSFLKIDTVLLDVSTLGTPFFVELSPGTYQIEIWAPKYNVFYDTLIVDSETNRYAVSLTDYSETYLEYDKKIKDYRLKQSTKVLITSGLVLANVLGAFYVYDRGEIEELLALQEDAEFLKTIHGNSIGIALIQESRSQYEAIQSEHNDRRRSLYNKRRIGIPVLVATSLTSAWFIQKVIRKKFEKPIYQDQNPFTLENIQLGVENNTGSVQLGLQFTF